jgi:hypothetical protein
MSFAWIIVTSTLVDTCPRWKHRDCRSMFCVFHHHRLLRPPHSPISLCRPFPFVPQQRPWTDLGDLGRATAGATTRSATTGMSSTTFWRKRSASLQISKQMQIDCEPTGTSRAPRSTGCAPSYTAKMQRLGTLRDTSRDTQARLIKRFKTAFEEVLGPPAVNEGDATDPSEEGAVDHDPAPTLPEDTTGPGDAAPAPEREEDAIQEQALERAAHSSEMPPAPGGQ